MSRKTDETIPGDRCPQVKTATLRALYLALAGKTDGWNKFRTGWQRLMDKKGIVERSLPAGSWEKTDEDVKAKVGVLESEFHANNRLVNGVQRELFADGETLCYVIPSSECGEALDKFVPIADSDKLSAATFPQLLGAPDFAKAEKRYSARVALDDDLADLLA